MERWNEHLTKYSFSLVFFSSSTKNQRDCQDEAHRSGSSWFTLSSSRICPRSYQWHSLRTSICSPTPRTLWCAAPRLFWESWSNHRLGCNNDNVLRGLKNPQVSLPSLISARLTRNQENQALVQAGSVRPTFNLFPQSRDTTIYRKLLCSLRLPQVSSPIPSPRIHRT